MTTEIALALAIIVAALTLFATEKLRVDLVALLVLLVGPGAADLSAFHVGLVDGAEW